MRAVRPHWRGYPQKPLRGAFATALARLQGLGRPRDRMVLNPRHAKPQELSELIQ